jgi:hypothetical protein
MILRLIRDLFDVELKSEHTIYRHDNLYQLSYYLYELGQYGDVFRLYDAKFSGSWDGSAMQDREMLHFGKSVSSIIAYVKQRFEDDAHLKKQYPTLLKELRNLEKSPDYSSIGDYTSFIRGYFFGHEEEENVVLKKSKPWWKFW